MELEIPGASLLRDEAAKRKLRVMPPLNISKEEIETELVEMFCRCNRGICQ